MKLLNSFKETLVTWELKPERAVRSGEKYEGGSLFIDSLLIDRLRVRLVQIALKAPNADLLISHTIGNETLGSCKYAASR